MTVAAQLQLSKTQRSEHQEEGKGCEQVGEQIGETGYIRCWKAVYLGCIPNDLTVISTLPNVEHSIAFWNTCRSGPSLFVHDIMFGRFLQGGK